jgi:geranylgeranyl pyrophosphate synthase
MKTDGRRRNVIFDAQLARNGQVTVEKRIREQMGIVAGDKIWFKIIRVVDSEGYDKYDTHDKAINEITEEEEIKEREA